MIAYSNEVGFYNMLNSEATATNDSDYSCYINVAELV